MEFVLVNKFFRVGKTEVSIQCDKPLTFFTRELEGDRLGDTDETLIEAIKEILRTELDPTSAIVKNQEQWAKTTEALEKANQLMDGMQKVNLQNAQDIEDILARLEELEAQGEPDQGEKEEAGENDSQATDTENQADEPAPVQPTTEQPVAEASTQPTPAVEDTKESEKEDDISETTNQESPSEDDGGSSDE
ncbi:hypothetical protein [Streptococcus toyakuensis]|uniref:Phage protein n=1 Tax=Streptococcus toyakuensis TaxID=2819619 RepID=A0ABM7UWV4_9STRE|nr:hypothetical protein [Streptococcus toyakuensis]BDB09256.1 hypothetical protein STYK_10700 [Streptococcus toyakuensis]